TNKIIKATINMAKNRNKTVKENTKQIINANAVETGNKAKQTIYTALGQYATSKKEELSAY
ncbi:hypothetical protein, partial [Escherichia coli]|uniref:hypothetical protein n=1 Tax=Escherichia coli TaxID=562 RepID=UPI00201D2718